MKTTVLLVDDERDFANALRDRLAERKCEAHAVYSGEEALAVLDDLAPDVVVLDLVMPGMDGLAAMKAIKERWPLTEVLVLTAHATLEDAILGLKLGAFDYLGKPTDIDELHKKIRFARKRKAQQESRIRKAQLEKILPPVD